MKPARALLAALLLFSPSLRASEPASTYHHFEVIDRDGKVAELTPIPPEIVPRWARGVSQEKHAWKEIPEPDKPQFSGPLRFVRAPGEGSIEPFHSHNHCPAVTWCPNGDLLACWFSTPDEDSTKMTILASRLRAGADEWDPASEFFKAEHRNMTGSALFLDSRGLLWHFNGMGPRDTPGWDKLALLARTSADNGQTWTHPRVISSGDRYQVRHQVIAGTLQTHEGTMIQACDATPGMEGGTALHISTDLGATWKDAGGTIRGIHAGVVALHDGRLMAFGRGQALEGKMPVSYSADMGKSWSSEATPFPPIGGGQRLILKRLREGPLVFFSFAKDVTDAEGKHLGSGLFAALSEDEGKTWPVRKLVTPGSGSFEGGAWTGRFEAAPDMAEPKGYLACTQTPDGEIHLLSSALHYRFNLAWLRDPAK